MRFYKVWFAKLDIFYKNKINKTWFFCKIITLFITNHDFYPKMKSLHIILSKNSRTILT